MVVEVVGAEAIPRFREAWLAMRDHHGSLTPDWGPVRSDEASWTRRSADYAEFLAEPDAFAVEARDAGGRTLGYGVVTVNEGSPTWEVGRFGYVESLSVVADARGRGVGRALLDAVQAQLGSLGVERIELTMVARNEDARRFYEREGFEVRFLHLVRPQPPARPG